ncbi:hypothetical protein ACIRCZ_18790 [Leifsonia sp. NPDC102414]|uniref:hypothetical protein n=1 Tax=Leifsonia sp. NPDC102414 TaxID=3364124 RepID=UPI0037F704A1
MYPFKGLAERSGVTYLQAHNGWLDVWLQLGVVGLNVFVLLVSTTVVRAWRFATAHTAGVAPQLWRLVPILVLAALIAQSVAESRMLVEGGWVLLVLIAVKATIEDRPEMAETVSSPRVTRAGS